VDKVGSVVDRTIYDWLNTTHLLTLLNDDLPWIFKEVSAPTTPNPPSLLNLEGSTIPRHLAAVGLTHDVAWLVR